MTCHAKKGIRTYEDIYVFVSLVSKIMLYIREDRLSIACEKVRQCTVSVSNVNSINYLLPYRTYIRSHLMLMECTVSLGQLTKRNYRVKKYVPYIQYKVHVICLGCRLLAATSTGYHREWLMSPDQRDTWLPHHRIISL